MVELELLKLILNWNDRYSPYLSTLEVFLAAHSSTFRLFVSSNNTLVREKSPRDNDNPPPANVTHSDSFFSNKILIDQSKFVSVATDISYGLPKKRFYKKKTKDSEVKREVSVEILLPSCASVCEQSTLVMRTGKKIEDFFNLTLIIDDAEMTYVSAVANTRKKIIDLRNARCISAFSVFGSFKFEWLEWLGEKSCYIIFIRRFYLYHLTIFNYILCVIVQETLCSLMRFRNVF